ncbi:MAG TPA: hypothetical protein VHO23_02600 [Candidatus Paceibacterota bacterium]|nr:hypothetical protein [Candidatus Paceibacterota bacterium]
MPLTLTKYELCLHQALAYPGRHTLQGLRDAVREDFNSIRDAAPEEVEAIVLNILTWFLAWGWVDSYEEYGTATTYGITLKGHSKEEPPKRPRRPPLKASR